MDQSSRTHQEVHHVLLGNVCFVFLQLMLLSTAPLLEPFRRDVFDSKCELRPLWAGGAWLLLPISRPEDLPQGIDLNEVHILVRSVDAGRIAAILRGTLRKYKQTNVVHVLRLRFAPVHT